MNSAKPIAMPTVDDEAPVTTAADDVTVAATTPVTTERGRQGRPLAGGVGPPTQRRGERRHDLAGRPADREREGQAPPGEVEPARPERGGEDDPGHGEDRAAQQVDRRTRPRQVVVGPGAAGDEGDPLVEQRRQAEDVGAVEAPRHGPATGADGLERRGDLERVERGRHHGLEVDGGRRGVGCLDAELGEESPELRVEAVLLPVEVGRDRLDHDDTSARSDWDAAWWPTEASSRRRRWGNRPPTRVSDVRLWRFGSTGAGGGEVRVA